MNQPYKSMRYSTYKDGYMHTVVFRLDGTEAWLEVEENKDFKTETVFGFELHQSSLKAIAEWCNGVMDLKEDWE